MNLSTDAWKAGLNSLNRCKALSALFFYRVYYHGVVLCCFRNHIVASCNIDSLSATKCRTIAYECLWVSFIVRPDSFRVLAYESLKTNVKSKSQGLYVSVAAVVGQTRTVPRVKSCHRNLFFKNAHDYTTEENDPVFPIILDLFPWFINDVVD